MTDPVVLGIYQVNLQSSGFEDLHLRRLRKWRTTTLKWSNGATICHPINFARPEMLYYFPFIWNADLICKEERTASQLLSFGNGVLSEGHNRYLEMKREDINDSCNRIPILT